MRYEKIFRNLGCMERFLKTTKKKEFIVSCRFGNESDHSVVLASRESTGDIIKRLEFKNGHVINVKHI